MRLEYAALAGLGLLMVLLIGFALWRRRGDLPADSIDAVGTTPLDLVRSRRIQEIADLEVELENGGISQEQYQRRRQELRAQLAAMSKRPITPSS